LFKKVKTLYHGVKGDFVYEGLPLLRNLGLGMIGNNPNAKPNRADLSTLEAHSEANQNINNLKFVYDENNEKSAEKWKNTLDILNKTHQDGIRKFNIVGDDK
ncbi:hypothetical protein, partial [Basilea psittacipulmonis]